MNSIVLIVLLFLPAFTNGDTMLSTAGQDFIFGFINNYYDDKLLCVLVSNANDRPTSVTVTSIYSTFETIDLIVEPYGVVKISITPKDIQARYIDLLGSPTLVTEDKGLRIQSTLPVSVYAHSELMIGYSFNNIIWKESNRQYFSADTFTILPIVHLGTRYVAFGTLETITYPNVIMAVAYQDNTMITIGDQQATLNALQVVSLAILNITSGITVTGNKPFAAFSGNMCGWGTTGYDYVMTTLLPTAVWGTQFPLVPFMNINTQQYQIVADTDGTIVNADGQQYQMNAGQYLLLNVSRSGMLTSNNPIQMVQIGQVDPNDNGDAFFLQVPSVEKWSNMTVFFQPTGYIAHPRPLISFIRIYTTLSGLGRIQFDNDNISALIYRRIGQTDYYYYEIQTSNDTHRISALDSNALYSVRY